MKALNSTKTWIVAALGVAALGGGIALRLRQPAPVVRSRPLPPVLAPKEKSLTSQPEIQSFVKQHAQSPDPKVQDRVGKARLQLGYLAARKKDFKAARATFQTAERECKGTQQTSADFGGIPDQAAYQAIVCLVADGKKEQAHREFLQFIKDHPLSPLAHAAYRRIERLNGGQPDAEGQRLLQSRSPSRRLASASKPRSAAPKRWRTYSPASASPPATITRSLSSVVPRTRGPAWTGCGPRSAS